MTKQATPSMMLEYGKWIDRRREKRYGPWTRDPVYLAYCAGDTTATSRNPNVIIIRRDDVTMNTNVDTPRPNMMTKYSTERGSSYDRRTRP